MWQQKAVLSQQLLWDLCQPRPRQKTDGTHKWGKWREFNKRLLTKAGAGKGTRTLFPKASNSQEAITWAGKKWLPEPGEHSCRRRSSNKSWNFPRSCRSYRLFLSVSYMYLLASKELASVLLPSLHCFFKSCLGMTESELLELEGAMSGSWLLFFKRHNSLSLVCKFTRSRIQVLFISVPCPSSFPSYLDSVPSTGPDITWYNFYFLDGRILHAHTHTHTEQCDKQYINDNS